MANRNYSRAAAVYARTLMDLGSEKGSLETLRQEMETLREVFAGLPSLGRALQLPALSTEQKASIANALLQAMGETSDLVKRLIRLLEMKGRLALLESIGAEFLRLEEESRKVTRARVVSATPLTEEQLRHLVEALSARSAGRTYLLHNDVDPSLIAGFRIEEGDRVTDASLRHKLNALQQKLAA
jgi:F-type H+-transporting ATPase subunit delta